MFSNALEQLINAAVTDGKLTDQERAVITRRAIAEGHDPQEVALIIDARLQALRQQQQAARPQVKKCPACGGILSGLETRCPSCGYQLGGDEMLKLMGQMDTAFARYADGLEIQTLDIVMLVLPCVNIIWGIKLLLKVNDKTALSQFENIYRHAMTLYSSDPRMADYSRQVQERMKGLKRKRTVVFTVTGLLMLVYIVLAITNIFVTGY
ncbi:MAG: hypothetical protein J6N92_08140 [Alloprevotella sp.]|nr:hypothetical protein [Alloprevotella sp.]